MWKKVGKHRAHLLLLMNTFTPRRLSLKLGRNCKFSLLLELLELQYQAGFLWNRLHFCVSGQISVSYSAWDTQQGCKTFLTKPIREAKAICHTKFKLMRRSQTHCADKHQNPKIYSSDSEQFFRSQSSFSQARLWTDSSQANTGPAKP